MKQTQIAWNDGEGYILAKYQGEGSGPLLLSSEPNEGLDRSQELIVTALEGNDTAKIKVNQIGKREEFQTSDDEIFTTTDNQTFGVIKEEFK